MLDSNSNGDGVEITVVEGMEEYELELCAQIVLCHLDL